MPDAAGRLRSRRWVYPALAAAIATLALLELFLQPDLTNAALAPVVVVLLCGPVAAAHRLPVAATVAEALLALLATAVDGDMPSSLVLPPAVLAYACGAHASVRAGAVAIALMLVVLLGPVGAEPVPIVLATLAAWWVGWQLRRRRELVSALNERTRELAAEEDAFVRLAVRRERARIAHELHDIVSHHLAVIVVQAGAGRMAAPGSNGQLGERLQSIRESGAQALAEMSRLVDLLHADEDGGEAGGRLRLLLERASAGGLDVRVADLPRELRLAPEVEDIAYRIVQEGLTNATKHAPGAPVHVRLAVNGEALELVVRDEGAGEPGILAGTGSGLGLAGMRQRTETLGGSFKAGPEPQGGWCLRARLPLRAPELTPTR